MKTGRSLTEIAIELDRQQKSKQDFVINTEVLEMTDEGKLHKKQFDQSDALPVTPHAHQQLGQRIGIPKAYYDKMLSDSPQLLATNVNHWFRKNPEQRMIRTMDRKVRAFLSDRYRPLDNFDLAEAVLPEIEKSGCKVVSTEITETKFYLKAITDRVTGELAKGDTVQAGMVISNSEIGAGSLKIEPLIFRLVCTNGLIATDYSVRKNHVGKRIDEIEDSARFYSSETRALDNKAFWAKVKDTVRGTLSETGFAQIVSGMKALKDLRPVAGESKPLEVVEDITGKFSMSEDERSGVLTHLIQGGDLSAFGIVNAVTRMSQDIANYDRATDFEHFGGDLLGWSKSEWRTVGFAA